MNFNLFRRNRVTQPVPGEVMPNIAPAPPNPMVPVSILRRRNGLTSESNNNESEDQQNQQSGEGVFLREPGKFPPESRKLIEQVGAEKVEKLTLFRYPIQISKFAKFIGALKNTPYDDLIHIGVVINGKYLTEKDAVLNFQRSGVPSQSTDTMDVLLGTRNITINDLLENTRKKMGDQRFTEYRALSWNCQDYLQNMLEANGLSTAETTKFIKQDLEQVVKNLPSYTSAISNFFTGAKAVVNRLVKGEGQYGGKADFETPEYIKEPSKKRIYTSDEIIDFLNRLDDMDIREAFLVGKDFLANAIRVEDDPTINAQTGEEGVDREMFEAVEDLMDELLSEIVRRTNNGEFAPDARFGTMEMDGEEESKNNGSWSNYFFGGADPSFAGANLRRSTPQENSIIMNAVLGTEEGDQQLLPVFQTHLREVRLTPEVAAGLRRSVAEILQRQRLGYDAAPMGAVRRVQGYGMAEDAGYIVRAITGKGEAGRGSYVHNFQLPPSKCKF